MFTITICDDVAINCDIAYTLVREYAQKKHLNTLIKVYTDPLEVLNSAASDLYLLDMLLPGLNGIELAIRLKEKYPNSHFVFISCDKNFAIEAYNVEADAYLVKPISYFDISKVLDRVIKQMKQSVFAVKTMNGDRRIAYDDLLYANCVNRAIEYHLVSGEIIRTVCVRGKIADSFGEQINHNGYMFMAPALLVNLAQIELINKEYVEFARHERLYYTQKYYKELRRQWGIVIGE